MFNSTVSNIKIVFKSPEMARTLMSYDKIYTYCTTPNKSYHSLLILPKNNTYKINDKIFILEAAWLDNIPRIICSKLKFKVINDYREYIESIEVIRN